MVVCLGLSGCSVVSVEFLWEFLGRRRPSEACAWLGFGGGGFERGGGTALSFFGAGEKRLWPLGRGMSLENGRIW